MKVTMKPLARSIQFSVLLGFLNLPCFAQTKAFEDLQPFSSNLTPSNSVSSYPSSVIADFGLDSIKSYQSVLQKVKGDKLGSIRGAKEVQLYKKVSPSVVLVVAENGLGSGSLINSSGEILTNWHVIAGAKEVGVIFKPHSDARALSKADVRRATVLKVDEVADLALLRINHSQVDAPVIEFGSLTSLPVGADVHAIGHPTGESWTYTKGFVSQIRPDYKWTSESKKAHKATVIQTQTPINPGNSGGPLFNDEGKLVGVNSFKSSGEGLNFAVSVDDVRKFLSSSSSRFANNVPTEVDSKKSSSCSGDPKELYSGSNKDNTSLISGYDVDCDGKVDFEIRKPNDVSKPVTWVFDANNDGTPDMIFFDYKRSGFIEFSLYDTNYDGKWDMVGYHPDGKLKASRYESYETFLARR